MQLPRLRGTGKDKRRARCINYRHVIEGLRRKPRAFLYCTWQQELLPNDQWRDRWQQLQAHCELDKAAVLIVESLYIAATQDNEATVIQYLQRQLDANTLMLATLRQHFGLLHAAGVPPLHIQQHELSSYDQLLSSARVTESLPKPEPVPQAVATLPHAEPLGSPRTSSHARELVLRTVLAGTMRLQRALSEAQLPNAKTLTNFDWSHVPKLHAAPLMQLTADPGWLGRAENLLLFGASGVGKTHLAAGLARRMVELGKRVKFFSAIALVQQLQQAKLQLQLQAALKKLDRFDLLILDDVGYVKKSEAETSVLFELIAHRYEHRSLLITANQPFSQWDTIFTDSMMTVAAVDRLVHHALIVEIVTESYRKQSAVVKAAITTQAKAEAQASLRS